MAEREGFGGWLREQFALPRGPDGRIDFGRLALGAGAGMALGPIGGLAARGLMNADFSNLRGDIRGVGTSFGRMFDGDPRTGFGNNPTAPWNRTPSNVAEGHPDFMGPSQPSGGEPFNYGRATSQGAWNFGGAQGNAQPRTTSGGQGVGGRSLDSINSALRALQNNPTSWRDFGSAGRLGIGGDQNSGIGPFGGFMNERGTLQMHNNIV